MICGSEADVLDRYRQAIEESKLDAVVRITGDCPLMDPDLIDEVVKSFRSDPEVDCVANTFDGHYPRGTDVFLCRSEALLRAWSEEDREFGRVHVTPYLRERVDLFRHRAIRGPAQNYRAWRWTLDEPDDLVFVRAIYDRLGSQPDFSWLAVKALVEADPALQDLNSQVRQKQRGEL